jgi:hypothetical protein
LLNLTLTEQLLVLLFQLMPVNRYDTYPLTNLPAGEVRQLCNLIEG